MTEHSKTTSTLGRRLPAKWIVAFFVFLIAYLCIQPILNRQLGWQLPSLAEVASLAVESEVSREKSPSPLGQESSNDEQAIPQGPGNSSADLTYGVLKQIGDGRYLSPAGLQYTRGSREGHRLKHLARHLVDDPNRPGSHGVFNGDMSQVLIWLDEAYLKAESREAGTTKKREDDRTVYEADLRKTVGYIGGQSGRRSNHPSSSQIRLVTEGKRVITAFPF